MARLTAEQLIAFNDNHFLEWKNYQVHYEPREGQNGWAIESFDIDREDFGRFKIIVQQGLTRDPGYGEGFTRIVRNGEVWMSDTRAEIYEHLPLFIQFRNWEHMRGETDIFSDGEPIATSVLINGLGLGMAVKAALKHGVDRIDVVEIDPDVIALVGPEFASEPRVTIHQGDALKIKWPRNTSWTFAWHDIWPTISEDNLPGMTTLMRRYGGRTMWQGCWQQDACRKLRRDSKVFEDALRRGDWATCKRIDPDF